MSPNITKRQIPSIVFDARQIPFWNGVTSKNFKWRYDRRRSDRNENFRTNKTFTKSNYAAACALIRSGNSRETTNFSSPVFPRMCYPIVFFTNYLRIVTSHSQFPAKEQSIRQSPKPINERSSWQTSNGTITPRSGLRFRLRV